MYSKLLLKNKSAILENVTQAKLYLNKEQITQEEFKMFLEIDPTPARKFVGWMAKQWISNSINDKDVLRNTIQEYNTFLEKNKALTKDINQFKTFSNLQDEVDFLNRSGQGLSTKDLESKYDTIIDNSDLLIVVPHTHEASRKLGLSSFAFRECKDGTKDSIWCTTYSISDHFNRHYYQENETLYYVRIRSQKLLDELISAIPQKGKDLEVVAIIVPDNEEGNKITYAEDGTNKRLSPAEFSKLKSIIGI